MNLLKIGIPKGSLQESTIGLFRKAGYTIQINGRSYYLDIDDDELQGMLLRPQDMALYVQKGVIDIGLAGRDWVRERNVDVIEVQELTYNKQTRKPGQWVVAVEEDSPYQRVEDLQGKTIWTELVETTKQYLQKKRIEAEVHFSHGVTEAKIPFLGEAIVEFTETGSSLRANRLRIIDEVMESVPVLIANDESWQDPWKRRKTENICMLLQGALEAENKVGLKLNVATSNLNAVLEMLPAMRQPTISRLSDKDWVAVETILDEAVVRDMVPELRRRGAEGIIEYPLNKVIP